MGFGANSGGLLAPRARIHSMQINQEPKSGSNTFKRNIARSTIILEVYAVTLQAKKKLRFELSVVFSL